MKIVKRPRVAKSNRRKSARNRRQFFNGLGKWSLAIIAAVTALRGVCMTCKAPLVRGSRPARGRGRTSPTDRQEEKPHGDQPHIDQAHDDYVHDHRDYYRLERQPGGTTRVDQVDLWTRRSDAGSR